MMDTQHWERLQKGIQSPDSFKRLALSVLDSVECTTRGRPDLPQLHLQFRKGLPIEH
jgi:hypothetical protein